MLERLVAYELHRRTTGIWPDASVFHFRTRGGAEVDFVPRVGRALWAIEVKASRNVDPRGLRGLHAFSERAARVERKVVVFLGDRGQALDGIEAIPLAEFLIELPS